MLPSFPSAVLVAALLTGAAEAAEPASITDCTATARFDLAAESSEAAPDVCVNADETTTFFFDSRVAVGALVFQPEGRLADWAQGKEGMSLHVVPQADYLPGERVRVTVRFADSTVPASASFWLVGHTSRSTRRVEVFRHPRPAEVLQKERDEAQAEARQCQEDKARLLAERKEPDGLMGAVWLERAGSILSKAIFQRVKQHPADVIRAHGVWSYNYTREGEARPAGVAVRLLLGNLGAESWKAAGAALVDATGATVVLDAWQEAPILPGPTGGLVVVGTDKAPEQFDCPCILKLWDAGGPRTVTVEDVEFPAVSPARE